LSGADVVAEYEKPVSGLEGERTSLAYLQLEKHNERLKEALIRSVPCSCIFVQRADSLDSGTSRPRMKKKARPRLLISKKS
jgi:hypothetical protein